MDLCICESVHAHVLYVGSACVSQIEVVCAFNTLTLTAFEMSMGMFKGIVFFPHTKFVDGVARHFACQTQS